jgi:flagellar motor switch protein FliM
MTQDADNQGPAIDRKLIALLTGELGDSQKIGKISAEFGQVFSSLLPDMIADETGLKLGFSYAGFASGMKNDLIADLDEYMVLADGAIRGWCADFTIACPSSVLIAMVESLLGADAEGIVEPVARPASRIELKMSPMLFDKIADVIVNTVDLPTASEAVLAKPHNAEDRLEPDEDMVDVFATEIRVAVSYGPVVSQFSVIVPQKALLKTRIRHPRHRGNAVKTQTEFAEQIAEQVRRSDVRLEARIRLQSLTLETISRLQVGDVIPFLDTGEVKVDVNANGKDLYVAEFGRAGEQYTVRVKDTHGTESDLLKHLIG